MTAEEFNECDSKFPLDSSEARALRKRDAQDKTIPMDAREVERAPQSDVNHAARTTRDHLRHLTNSRSFMLAMSHVCSLKQKIKYNNEVAPNSVAGWDRKTWSAENHFSTPGVSVDVGNFVLATMLLAIRHSFGMEATIDPHHQGALDAGGALRPAPWTDPHCQRHPIVSGSATAGMARKEGYVQSIANLARHGRQTAESFRIVIEMLIQDEVDHQVSTLTQLTDATCETLGDVLEAAGGLLCPYTPAAKPFMMSMHAANGISPTDDADAFRSLQGLAQSIKDLSYMIPAPKSRDGTSGDNSARI